MRTRVTLAALALLLGAALLGCGGGKKAAFGNPPTFPPATSTAVPTDVPTPAPSPTPWSPPAFFNAASPLDIPTYEGSGQAVHPDVVYFPNGWRGHKYWMAMTPYPFDAAAYENPSILVSDDGFSWRLPDGLTNPVVPSPACDHNSDPDLVYDPRGDQLLLYYTEQLRADRCPGTNKNSIRLVRSADGVNWSEPETVISWDLNADPLFLSPAVLYRDGVFQMWLAGGAGKVAHATSDDGIRWSLLDFLEVSPVPWHLDVTELDGELVMLIVDSPVAGARLSTATSMDGQVWSAGNAILNVGNGWDNERIYRSTMLYDATSGLLRLWYSARSAAGQWHIGYSEAKR